VLTEAQQRERAVALGVVIRRRRRALGLKQWYLAELAGCERQTINRLENAAYSTLVTNIERIADALGWTTGGLFNARDALIHEWAEAAGRES
jgi:DNA-binding XRE family transcriptional regulator